MRRLSRARHGDEAGERFDAADPGANGGVGLERHAPFVTERDIGHAGDVGDGRAIAREPVVLLQMRFEQTLNAGGVLAGALDIDGVTELVVQPGIARSARDLVLGDHEPAHDFGHGDGIGRQPVLAAEFPGEVDEDGLGIPQDHVAVLEDGDVAVGVHVDERTLLVGTGHEVDRHEVELQSEQRAEEPDLVAIPRRLEVVQLQLGHVILHWRFKSRMPAREGCYAVFRLAAVSSNLSSDCPIFRKD
ncbi:hypothetical protein AUC69_09205 [Methyloceanibacter superfactus]|uniref:Uncharacterized protein n=1 Tax=Methyloceanibacter superfactus TaxID=1774969 RepID=A0A1E3W1T3_9HYPH|nr:hypothetical protein AUC69_09205 [Methyloceanibacter superfactus]